MPRSVGVMLGVEVAAAAPEALRSLEAGERAVQAVLHRLGVAGVEELAAPVHRGVPQVVEVGGLRIARHRPVAGRRLTQLQAFAAPLRTL